MGGSGKRELTKSPGVYMRTSPERKHDGKADVCFDIAYDGAGRKVWEKVGWPQRGLLYSSHTRLDGREAFQGWKATIPRRLTGVGPSQAKGVTRT